MKPSTRKVVSRAPMRTVRLINLKGLLPHPVEAESSLEADYIRRAAFAPFTQSILAQPFTLPVSPKGYTPDFFQVCKGFDSLVVEIKLEKKVTKYSDLFDRAAEFLRSKGYIFYVLTERTLRKQKIHERALMLRRYAKASFPLDERTRVSSVLSEYPHGIAMGSLLRKAQVTRELVIHLIAWKILTTGPKLHLDESTLVFLAASYASSNAFTFDRWFDVFPWGESTGAPPRSAGTSNQDYSVVGDR